MHGTQPSPCRVKGNRDLQVHFFRTNQGSSKGCIGAGEKVRCERGYPDVQTLFVIFFSTTVQQYAREKKRGKKRTEMRGKGEGEESCPARSIQIALPYLLLSIRSLNRPAEPFLSPVASLRPFGCQVSKENALS